MVRRRFGILSTVSTVNVAATFARSWLSSRNLFLRVTVVYAPVLGASSNTRTESDQDRFERPRPSGARKWPEQSDGRRDTFPCCLSAAEPPAMAAFRLTNAWEERISGLTTIAPARVQQVFDAIRSRPTRSSVRSHCGVSGFRPHANAPRHSGTKKICGNVRLKTQEIACGTKRGDAIVSGGGLEPRAVPEPSRRVTALSASGCDGRGLALRRFSESHSC